MKRLAALLIASTLLLTPVFAPLYAEDSALKLDMSTQKVPAGTYLNVVFNTALDSRISSPGEPFAVALSDDFKITGNGASKIILPKGTFIRGRVDNVKRPGFFSRGGSIFLTFDHAVLPSGELMPLDLKLSTTNAMVKKGALYSDPGIPKKLGNAANSGANTFSGIVDKGFEAGKGVGDGLGQIVTVPLAVLGGAVAGTAVTTGKGAVAIVGKGDSIVIEPGDNITIDFGGSFNLPAE